MKNKLILTLISICALSLSLPVFAQGTNESKSPKFDLNMSVGLGGVQMPKNPFSSIAANTFWEFGYYMNPALKIGVAVGAHRLTFDQSLSASPNQQTFRHLFVGPQFSLEYPMSYNEEKGTGWSLSFSFAAGYVNLSKLSSGYNFSNEFESLNKSQGALGCRIGLQAKRYVNAYTYFAINYSLDYSFIKVGAHNNSKRNICMIGSPQIVIGVRF